MKKAVSIIGVSLVLAAASGFAVATAIGQEAPAPTKTVTITLKNGDQGPPGPIGPQGATGPQGVLVCPNDFEIGDLVINHPGGQVTIYGCLKEGG